MKIKKRWTSSEWFGLIFFITVLISGGLYHYKSNQDKLNVKENYRITKGKFERYDKVGGTGIPYITYSYFVDGKKYVNQVEAKMKYDYCYKNNNCKNKRFWVIYSPDDPIKSLIDLSMEIQGMEAPPFPETLVNFK